MRRMSDFPNAKTRNRILNELIEYCKYYNVPFEHVVDTMHALKVVPMIRGIGVEYVAEERLKEILPREFWKVEKPTINAQSAIQDIDVLITQISTGKKIQIECKVAGKDYFRNPKLGQGFIKVKCMRSRTVGEKAAKPLAKRYGVSLRDVLNHKDNYRDVDFDFVITSIGNAFWKTTDEGKYIFHLDDEEKVFLHGLFKDKTLSVDQLRSKTFDYLLIARSSALIA